MKLAIATRLHLGKASSPPSEEKTKSIVFNLKKIANDVASANEYEIEVLVAVDATPILENYDYVEAVRSAIECCESVKDHKRLVNIHIIPVMPWGKFVFGLNALVLHAKSHLEADLIMFMSAEVNISSAAVRTLCRNVTENKNILVAGAAMNGHQYHADVSDIDGKPKRQVVPLTGRTTPWNTLSVWNLDKLSLTGFSMISDLGQSAGVEECVAIALLQKLFPESEARLVKVDGIAWEETFQDMERKKWHDEKMKSKIERPKIQLDIMGISGVVTHC
mmetsp:Transcript_17919/g.41322  ORF Transcript_17919/g.41322 Transcript_17919/m.41322 type:complete len:277 (-) Transcript_17919:245-1075(-)